MSLSTKQLEALREADRTGSVCNGGGVRVTTIAGLVRLGLVTVKTERTEQTGRNGVRGNGRFYISAEAFITDAGRAYLATVAS